MRVVAMFRVSTERQANEGASLEAQERQYHELALRSGWNTLATFRGCESATQASSERAVLQDVLSSIRKLAPDAIYVHEQSRLTRGDELEVAGLLRELRERRLKIIVGGVVRDLSSLDERFMVGIQSLVDRAEAERIKERHQRGKKEKARRGLKNTGPSPYGYRNPPHGAPDRGRLQIVHEEAVTVRRIFSLASEGLSSRAIADTLTEEGIVSPRGGAWGKTTIVRILKNPAYRGCHVSGGWVAEPGSRTFRFNQDHPGAIVVEDAHDPIVSSADWEAAQRRLSAPRTVRPRMLSGLLSVNGMKATGDTERGRAFYRPPRGTRGGPWIPAAIVDGVVWDSFVRTVSEPQFLEELVAKSCTRAAQDSIDVERERLIASIPKLEAKLSRLVDLRVDGDITKEQFRERSQLAREQISGAKRRLLVLDQRQAQGDGTWVRQIFAAAKLLVSSKRSLSTAERRRVLMQATRSVHVLARRLPDRQRKDARGRYMEVERPPWKIESVSFEFLNVNRDGDQQLTTDRSCSAPPAPAKP